MNEIFVLDLDRLGEESHQVDTEAHSKMPDQYHKLMREHDLANDH